MKRSRWTVRGILSILALLVGLCLLMLAVIYITSDGGANKPTPTTASRGLEVGLSTNTPVPANTLVPPTLTATATLKPLIRKTTKPTATSVSRKIILPTATRAANKKATPTVKASAKKPTATKGASTSSCNCRQDYDCKNFTTHSTAQSCFVSCGGSKTKNWSNLDSDGDGQACESLP